jgi:hypothetical protein
MIARGPGRSSSAARRIVSRKRFMRREIARRRAILPWPRGPPGPGLRGGVLPRIGPDDRAACRRPTRATPSPSPDRAAGGTDPAPCGKRAGPRQRSPGRASRYSCDRRQLGISQRSRDAVSGGGVLGAPGIANEDPAGTCGWRGSPEAGIPRTGDVRVASPSLAARSGAASSMNRSSWGRGPPAVHPCGRCGSSRTRRPLHWWGTRRLSAHRWGTRTRPTGPRAPTSRHCG